MATSDNAVMLGPWGRTGGTFWEHVIPDPNDRVSIIKIWYGAFIDCITVGSVENRDINNDCITICLGPDEFITDCSFGFSETDAKYLSWIRFITNGNNSYGPFGTVTNSEISIPLNKSKLLGFFGWNEWPISSIGVVLAPSSNVVKVGPWGLTDGLFWEHTSNDRVSEISIWYGARIDCINVGSDEKRDINNDNIKAKAKQSAPGGDANIVISLDPDEFIKEFFMYFEPDSKCLLALGFTTNKNMHGPYGTVTTSVFTLPVTKGKLLGFFGNNEVPINSIGFEFAP